MFKKCLLTILSCSFLISPLRAHESNESYLKQTWHALKKKMTTITKYGDEQQLATFGVCSMLSTVLGLKLWQNRNHMVEVALRDDNGKLVSNMDELFDWIQKIKKSGADVAKVILGQDFKNNECISTTGESFTYTIAAKLEPYSSSLQAKKRSEL